MKRLKRPFKERWRLFKLKFRNNWFISWIAGQYIQVIRLWMFAAAKRTARRWHKKTGRRFYVIPVSNYSFVVMNNLMRKAYNRKVGRRMGISLKRLDAIEYWNTGLKKETQPKEIKVKKFKTKKHEKETRR